VTYYSRNADRYEPEFRQSVCEWHAKPART